MQVNPVACGLQSTSASQLTSWKFEEILIVQMDVIVRVENWKASTERAGIDKLQLQTLVAANSITQLLNFFTHNAL